MQKMHCYRFLAMELKLRALATLNYVDIIAKEGSIRRAAEVLNITSTALNRRILSLEEELGYPVFERTASGVRLNTAGELLVNFTRKQNSDFDRMKSQMADLAGVRRGHITISATPEVLRSLLPRQIAIYRKQHPGVTFSIKRQYRQDAETSLIDHVSDIAMTFEPVQSNQFKVMAAIPQQLHIVMSVDHPLASKDQIRLRDCIGHPIVLPTPENGIRQLVDASLLASPLPIAVIGETDSIDFLHAYLKEEMALSFEIPIGMTDTTSLIARPIDPRDVRSGTLHIGQLRDRVLSVAAAKFLEQMMHNLERDYPDPANETTV